MSGGDRQRAATSRHASLHRTQRGAGSDSGSGSSSDDLERITQRLKRKGLGIRDVRRDGNCFFRAVSDQLYGTEKHHAFVRKECCDYMDDHEDELGPFRDEDEDDDYEAYVNNMRSDGVWAGSLEMQAASMHFKRDFRIYPSERDKDQIDHSNFYRSAPSIHLLYLNGEHYMSVRPLDRLDDDEPVMHPSIKRPSRTSRQSAVDASGSGAAAARGGGGTPRARTRARPPVDVHGLWADFEQRYCTIAMKVEHCEAAARWSRRQRERDGGLASRLDDAAQEASDDLAHVQDRLDFWKRRHAERNEHRRTGGESASDESSVSSDESESAGWALDASQACYARACRRERRYIKEQLAGADHTVQKALNAAHRIRGDSGAPRVKKRSTADAAAKAMAKPRRTSRRDRQQQVDAPSIGIWSIRDTD